MTMETGRKNRPLMMAMFHCQRCRKLLVMRELTPDEEIERAITSAMEIGMVPLSAAEIADLRSVLS